MHDPIPLSRRGLLELAGPDRVAFLQGLVTNDVTRATPGVAVWSALLTAQGRILAEFFITTRPDGEALWLEVERALVPDLIRRLSPFRLRSKVTLADRSAEMLVAAAPPDATGPWPDGTAAFADPRLPSFGGRLILPAAAGAALATGDPAAYESARLAAGLPEGAADLPPEADVALEGNLDLLHGVDWQKGCYLGQELTARTHYRGLVKRRLVPVTVAGGVPPPGTPVLGPEGQEVGELRSGQGELALALLRRDAVGSALTALGRPVTPRIPDWLRPALG